jgi:hypothetical protein
MPLDDRHPAVWDGPELPAKDVVDSSLLRQT